MTTTPTILDADQDAKRATRRPLIVELPFDPAKQPVVHARVQRGASLAAAPRLPNGPLLNSQEVAARLGVSQRWVTDKFSAGLVVGYRLPGSNRLRFDWSEVIECLEKNGGE